MLPDFLEWRGWAARIRQIWSQDTVAVIPRWSEKRLSGRWRRENWPGWYRRMHWSLESTSESWMQLWSLVIRGQGRPSGNRVDVPDEAAVPVSIIWSWKMNRLTSTLPSIRNGCSQEKVKMRSWIRTIFWSSLHICAQRLLRCHFHWMILRFFRILEKWSRCF